MTEKDQVSVASSYTRRIVRLSNSAGRIFMFDPSVVIPAKSGIHSTYFVIPAHAGIQCRGGRLVSRMRGKDGMGCRPRNCRPQIYPIRVRFFNRRQLPLAQPFFHRLLAADRAFHCFVLLVPHQDFQAILFRKTIRQTLPMLPDTLHQIGSYPDLQGPVTLAGEHVNGGVLHHLRPRSRHSRACGNPAVATALGSRMRGNDGIGW